MSSLLASLTGCGMSAAKTRAEAAVEVFHRQLNAGDFDGIWKAADDAFRRGSPRDKYDLFMSAVHRKLGRALKTTNVNWSVRNFNLQTSVVLEERTDFEHGSGIETFTYSLGGDGAKLVGYNINSTELVTL